MAKDNQKKLKLGQEKLNMIIETTEACFKDILNISSHMQPKNILCLDINIFVVNI